MTRICAFPLGHSVMVLIIALSLSLSRKPMLSPGPPALGADKVRSLASLFRVKIRV